MFSRVVPPPGLPIDSARMSRSRNLGNGPDEVQTLNTLRLGRAGGAGALRAVLNPLRSRTHPVHFQKAQGSELLLDGFRGGSEAVALSESLARSLGRLSRALALDPRGNNLQAWPPNRT
jgi:hypothetical protein